jgi:hypothetical protein
MKVRKEYFPLLALLAFAACTHEEEAPKKQWSVKTSTDHDKKIWITRADGSQQCGPKAPSPADVARKIQQAGILVYKSQTGTDGQMHNQSCGSPTGRTIDLLISRPDLGKALTLGFVTKSGSEAN